MGSVGSPAGLQLLAVGMALLPAFLDLRQAIESPGSAAIQPTAVPTGANHQAPVQQAGGARPPAPHNQLSADLQLLRAAGGLLISTAAAAGAGEQQPRPATGLDSGSCSPASASRPLLLPAGPLLQPAGVPAAIAPASTDYRQSLSTTALGWPRLQRWCVWLEPVSAAGPAASGEQRWWQASEQALRRWQLVLPIEQVDDPAAAQIRILRRRPRRQPGPDGRLRASHGRASLQLLEVTRSGRSRPEPSVEVLISPDQRPLAIEATALHELGHAFGLWGHSERAEDAMAAVPGAAPVLELSPRDQATLRWLYAQPTRFGAPPSADQTRGPGGLPTPGF
ncbi:MAG: hypothetical protein WAM11_08615 [Cyanobium sp.]